MIVPPSPHSDKARLMAGTSSMELFLADSGLHIFPLVCRYASTRITFKTMKIKQPINILIFLLSSLNEEQSCFYISDCVYILGAKLIKKERNDIFFFSGYKISYKTNNYSTMS